MTTTLTVTDAPPPQDAALIVDGLAAANEAMVGAAGRRALAVFVGGADGAVLGGLAGYTAWGWLHIEKIWLHESVRGGGLTPRLLEMAEQEAVRRGCQAAWLDSFNPAALRIYARYGYAEFGRLDGFPVGRSRVFLHKSLGIAGDAA